MVAGGGTMPPDSQPRKVMGGGFRSHNPTSRGGGGSGGLAPQQPTSSAAAAAAASSGSVPGGASGIAAAGGRVKSEQELKAELDHAKKEREYIENLSAQVKLLETELRGIKGGAAAPAPAVQPSPRPKVSISSLPATPRSPGPLSARGEPKTPRGDAAAIRTPRGASATTPRGGSSLAGEQQQQQLLPLSTPRTPRVHGGGVDVLPGLSEARSPGGFVDIADVVQTLKERAGQVQAENVRLKAMLSGAENAHATEVGSLESKIAVLEGHVGSLRSEMEGRAAQDVQDAGNKVGSRGGGEEGGGGRMRDLERQVELLRKERDERGAGEQDALMRAKRAEDKVSSLEDEGRKAGERCAAALEEARKAKADVQDMRREAELNGGSLSGEQERRLMQENEDMMRSLEMERIKVRRLEAEAKGREEVIKELRDGLRHAKGREAEAAGRAARAGEAREGGEGGDGRGVRAVVELESKLKTAEEQIKVLKEAYEGARAAESSARAEKGALKGRNEQLEADAASARDAKDAAMAHAMQVGEEAARLRVDLEARGEGEQDARAVAEAAMAERDKAVQEAAEFKKEAHRLRYKGEVAKAKGVLEGSELLVESNQQVSRGITSLLAGIKAITDTP